MYANETQVAALAKQFSMLAIFLACMGLYGLAAFLAKQRTREIGIRMAIGAKGKDILTQFMIESIVISLAGGILGIVLGILASQLVAKFGGWPVVVTSSSVLLSFFFSSAIGLFFGWYPARKAAALNPIDALRFE